MDYPMTELEELKHNDLLWDIGFSSHNLVWAREMYGKHAFGSKKAILEQITGILKAHLNAELEEYERRYSKKPKVDDVNRVFDQDKGATGVKG